MAEKSKNAQYKYKINMAYIDKNKKTIKNIDSTYIKALMIDHNYDSNVMPVMYAILALDRKLLDDMILNCNTNLLMVNINKFDALTDDRQEIEVLRKKFTYYLSSDVNKYDPLDYTNENLDESMGATFMTVTIGLMDIELINKNKQSFNFLLKKTNINKAVDKVLESFSDIVKEPIGDSTEIGQLMMPTQTSVNKALSYLNNIRVLYDSKYRFYQDYNFVYLLSSNGKPVKKKGELYTSVMFDIRDISESGANDVGVVIDKSSQTYRIPVNYVYTNIWDNTISNKSETDLVGMMTTGSNSVSLQNKTDYLSKKENTLRMYNDNDGMLKIIKDQKDKYNFIVVISKNDIDSDILTPNKRITINHIERYQDHNGDYLMYRRKEIYIRQNDEYVMSTSVYLGEIAK